MQNTPKKENVSGDAVLIVGTKSRRLELPSSDGWQSNMTVFNMGSKPAHVMVCKADQQNAVATVSNDAIMPGASETFSTPGRSITGRCRMAAITSEGSTALCVAVE